MHFIALICFNTCGKKRSKVHWPGSGVKCSQIAFLWRDFVSKKNHWNLTRKCPKLTPCHRAFRRCEVAFCSDFIFCCSRKLHIPSHTITYPDFGCGFLILSHPSLPCCLLEVDMEVEKKVDELPAADPPAQPEEAAVPLAFWGPLGKGIHLGFGTLGYAFCI